jgi:hypothetical protein
VEKKLLPGGKNKFVSAGNTGQSPIRKFHLKAFQIRQTGSRWATLKRLQGSNMPSSHT